MKRSKYTSPPMFLLFAVLSQFVMLSFAIAQQQKETVEPYSIAMLVGDLGNPFFLQVSKSAEIEAKLRGGQNTFFSIASSGYDLDRQILQLENFVQTGYDLILLNAADSKKIKTAVENARAAGAIIIAIDVEAEGAHALVTSDNNLAGRLACEFLAKRLNYQGKVIILNGPPVSAIYKRVEGCKHILENHPDIEVLSSDQNAGASLAGGLSSMSDLMTRHDKIDAIFAINDPTAIGADLAAQQSNRHDFFIVSVDGSPDGLKALSTHNSRIVATVAQYPDLMAEAAIDVGFQLLAGKRHIIKELSIPVKLITNNTKMHPFREKKSD